MNDGLDIDINGLTLTAKKSYGPLVISKVTLLIMDVPAYFVSLAFHNPNVIFKALRGGSMHKVMGTSLQPNCH